MRALPYTRCLELILRVKVTNTTLVIYAGFLLSINEYLSRAEGKKITRKQTFVVRTFNVAR